MELSQEVSSEIVSQETLNHTGYKYLGKESDFVQTQFSFFEDIPDLEDFPDFTKEENISDNTVNELVEKSDLSQTEKNTSVNDLSEVSAEKQEKEPTVKKEYFRITDEHLGEGSKREKFQNNIEAIKTLQLIDNEDRSATP